MFSIGCLAGALLAGGEWLKLIINSTNMFNYLHINCTAVSDWIGRKLAIIVGGVIFTVGAVSQSSAYFVW